MPSIGSTNQKFSKLLTDLLWEVSSDTIGILGVSSKSLEVTILFTSRSPLLTGVLSDFISFVNPFSLSSKATFPALRKVSIKSSTVF